MYSTFSVKTQILKQKQEKTQFPLIHTGSKPETSKLY